MNTSDPALPNYTRPEVVAARPDLTLVADLLAGTRRMWEQSQAAGYIRKWADEDPKVYDVRRKSGTLFEGLARVLSAAVGMLFAKPPAMTWNDSEAAMREHWANLDGAGTAGPVLTKRFADRVIRDGLGLILVDHPPAPPGVVITAANEITLGLRPMWALYQRSQLLSWREGVVANRQLPTQIVLEECRAEPVGLYGVAEMRRYRVLWLEPTETGGYVARWRLWRETKDTGAGGFVLESEGVFLNRAGGPSDVLPVAIAYTGRTEAMCTATIPLLGVAFANLSHFRLSTELMFGRMVSAIEQPYVVGDLMKDVQGNPGKIKLGWMTAVHIATGGEFGWKGPSGLGLAQLVAGCQEFVTQIGQMGMSFLVTDTRAAETAEAKRLDATAENSTLATAAQAIEDAWNLALELHAWYLGIPKAGAPVMTISKDFDAVALDPETMTAYVGAVANAGLPVRLLLEAWQQGGRIPADADLEALEAEMMAGQAAAADAAAQKQADALAMGGAREPQRFQLTGAGPGAQT